MPGVHQSINLIGNSSVLKKWAAHRPAGYFTVGRFIKRSVLNIDVHGSDWSNQCTQLKPTNKEGETMKFVAIDLRIYFILIFLFPLTPNTAFAVELGDKVYVLTIEKVVNGYVIYVIMHSASQVQRL